MPVIGWLNVANPRSSPQNQAFEQRLRELGYVDGQNIAVDFRSADGDVGKLPGLAADLVRRGVNVIVTTTDPGTRAAKAATATIPIVMVAINYDPTRLVTSTASLDLARTLRGCFSSTLSWLPNASGYSRKCCHPF